MGAAAVEKPAETARRGQGTALEMTGQQMKNEENE